MHTLLAFNTFDTVLYPFCWIEVAQASVFLIRLHVAFMCLCPRKGWWNELTLSLFTLNAKYGVILMY